MPKEFELWQFIHERLIGGVDVMLLVVVESSGSSPGRAGYKMAVAADGELCGSIGGGVMEVALVDQSRNSMSVPPAAAGGAFCGVIEQIHQKNAPNSSGMICSGRQTVILRQMNAKDAETVRTIVRDLENKENIILTLTSDRFTVDPLKSEVQIGFERRTQVDFTYKEELGPKNELVIVGGGHCALALSQIAAKLDFHIRIFDDRPELNTLEKNRFADEITIIDSYERIGDHVTSGERTYAVVMTLGYSSDAAVIRQLIDRDFKYFGVLGSKAKMATLMKELRAEGIDEDRLANIRTPIGLTINSRTPEEIAVSIAAEIVSVKNE